MKRISIRKIMTNQLELLKIFCVAAESESFKQAAIALGKSPQTVTRAIQELEASRGEILFYRTTRNSKITREGELFAKKAKLIIQEMDNLLRIPSSEDDDLMTGQISLTIPASLGRRFVLPALISFHQQYPGVDIRCVLTDSHSDVIDGQIDIGLRTGFIRDNRFVARKVLDFNFFLVGTPDLIQRVGTPVSLEQLNTLPVVALLDNKTNRCWPWGFEHSRSFIPDSPGFITDDLDAYCEAVAQGLGFGHLPGFLAYPYMDSGKLIPVMQDIASSPWGLYLFRPQSGPVPLRIRKLYDHLYDSLKNLRT
ncbi:LysR family transcriptional regulator [Escherichia coli]|nr:LysR family transcriptional regulator [Escherichia coli]MED0029230.1 LysR family transcriptional regulator [Escherichia coli]MED9557662.1 LysR family transcriptional regulator [Escherichia coli]MED9750962.1 LysR family transcriptional regulator [Escherichia coli]